MVNVWHRKVINAVYKTGEFRLELLWRCKLNKMCGIVLVYPKWMVSKEYDTNEEVTDDYCTANNASWNSVNEPMSND